MSIWTPLGFITYTTEITAIAGQQSKEIIYYLAKNANPSAFKIFMKHQQNSQHYANDFRSLQDSWYAPYIQFNVHATLYFHWSWDHFWKKNLNRLHNLFHALQIFQLHLISQFWLHKIRYTIIIKILIANQKNSQTRFLGI